MRSTDGLDRTQTPERTARDTRLAVTTTLVAALTLAAGLGWMLAIVLLAGLRKRMGYSRVPVPLQGVAITMIVTGVMAMAFMGFAGMIQVK